jgi:hypothetical protein
VTDAGGPLSASDRATLKKAAFGAVYLVSRADPGFFAMVRESAAASGALTGATGLVGEVFTSGGLPKLPRDDAQAEAVVLPALRASVEILGVKAPDEVETYRETVLTAVERAAAAAHGVTPQETAVVAKIRAALAA